VIRELFLGEGAVQELAPLALVSRPCATLNNEIEAHEALRGFRVRPAKKIYKSAKAATQRSEAAISQLGKWAGRRTIRYASSRTIASSRSFGSNGFRR